MNKKIQSVILFLGAYLLVFWIGFTSGTIYLRMQKKIQIERVEFPGIVPSQMYYIVETHNYGTFSTVSFQEAPANDTIIQIFTNEKTRPLLKLRDIKIYNKNTGEQLY